MSACVTQTTVSSICQSPTKGPVASMRRLPDKQNSPYVLSLLGKGGSSKSTTAIQLAGIASTLRHRVLILDTDPQQSVSRWRSLRPNDGAVSSHFCRPQDVAARVAQAGKLGFELVVIDNAPVRTEASDSIARLSDLSLIMVRPSMLDLVVGLDWISWLNATLCPFVVVVGAAPAIRQGMEAPFMRQTRVALAAEAKRLWKGQITFRHAIVESVGMGATLMETDPAGPGASEFCRLWNDLIAELERVK